MSNDHRWGDIEKDSLSCTNCKVLSEKQLYCYFYFLYNIYHLYVDPNRLRDIFFSTVIYFSGTFCLLQMFEVIDISTKAKHPHMSSLIERFRTLSTNLVCFFALLIFKSKVSMFMWFGTHFKKGLWVFKCHKIYFLYLWKTGRKWSHDLAHAMPAQVP